MAGVDLEQKRVALAAVVALVGAADVVLSGEGGAVDDLERSAHDQRHGYDCAGAHDENSCFAQRGLGGLGLR